MQRRCFVSFILCAGAALSAAAEDLSVLEKTGKAFTAIAKEARPAVVFIQTDQVIEMQTPDFYRNDPFEFFFGRPFGNSPFDRGQPRRPVRPRQQHRQAQGSGFIISKDGYIMTNNHVVQDADTITVKTYDGREFQAELIGTDPKSEVALIKIEADDLPVLKLGDSDKLEVGEWVVAIGNPFGLSETVTAGIVSATGRNAVGIAEYENFIQTDAAINPGNSGGPLLNIEGDVIGINTAIYSQSGGYMGIGFAIPVNMAKSIRDQLIEFGEVRRSYLGIYIQEVNQALAESFGLESAAGILISQVTGDSAAEEAGLRQGDIVLEMDGKAYDNTGEFRNAVSALKPGTEVGFKIFRDGKEKNVTVTTKSLDGRRSPGGGPENDADALQISVSGLTPELAGRLGYDADEKGVAVTDVEEYSKAWNAGIRPGQLIVSVNRQIVETPAEFRKAIRKADKQALLLVKDPNGSRYVVLSME